MCVHVCVRVCVCECENPDAHMVYQPSHVSSPHSTSPQLTSVLFPLNTQYRRHDAMTTVTPAITLCDTLITWKHK